MEFYIKNKQWRILLVFSPTISICLTSGCHRQVGPTMKTVAKTLRRTRHVNDRRQQHRMKTITASGNDKFVYTY